MMNIKNSMKVSVIAATILPVALNGQVRMTVPPQAEAVAIQGATIHTVTNGVIEDGTIIFNDGVITSIGANLDIPAGTRVVDGEGKHIYPGLIDAYSTVGISEIGAVGVSNDVNELGDVMISQLSELFKNKKKLH